MQLLVFNGCEKNVEIFNTPCTTAQINTLFLEYRLSVAGEYNLIYRSPYEIWGFKVLSGQSPNLFSLTGDKRSLRYTAVKQETIKVIVFYLV